MKDTPLVFCCQKHVRYICTFVRDVVVFQVRYSRHLSSACGVVVDCNEVPEGHYIYRIKADGEASWVIRMGSLWFVCRANASLVVTGVIPCDSIYPVEVQPPVIRCEQMADGTLVYIDVLCDGSNVVKTSKPYVSPYLSLKYIHSKPKLFIRKDHDYFEDTDAERFSTYIPNDGVVAIDRRTTTTYRIKFPSVDLEMINGDLVTYDENGKMLKITKADSAMQPHKIYECTIVGTSMNDLEILFYTLRSLVYRG